MTTIMAAITGTIQENMKNTSFSNIHISFRIVLPAVVTFSLFILVFFFILIPSFESIIMEKKREQIHERAQFAWNIIAQYEKEVRNGELSLEEAQSLAIRFLRNIQYGKDKLDYFWINDNYPNFIMHPYRNDIVGKNFENLTDSAVQNVLVDINTLADSVGEGFLEYMWQWQNDPHNITPKISYVKRFDPWGWTVGTGMYVHDVEKEIALLKDRFNASAAIILFLTGVLLLFIVYNNVMEERNKEHAKRALRESEKKYRHLVESANSIILRLNTDGNITFINKFAEGFFGYAENEMLGKNIVGTIVEPSESFNQTVNTFLKNPDMLVSIEIKNIRATGETAYITWTNKAVYDDDGNLKEILCIGNDVTEFRLAEEKYRKQQLHLIQADKMTSLGILVTGVAHEINNPNQIIMGNTGVMKRLFESFKPLLDFYYEKNGEFEINGIHYDELHEQIIEMLSDIQSGSNRIKFIVQELKDFARLQPGELMESIDFNAVIRSAIILTTNMIKKSTYGFSVQYSDGIPLIKGNFQRLEQVMINLLQNACQAIQDPARGISLTTGYDINTDSITCVLKDEGVGMSKDTLGHITDPFFTTKRDTGGTGLGLSISSNIIAEHGGTLTFRSTPDIGTTVTITLPVQRDDTHLENVVINEYVDTSAIIRLDN